MPNKMEIYFFRGPDFSTTFASLTSVEMTERSISTVGQHEYRTVMQTRSGKMI
jgi:hypothetical protein